MSVQGAGGGQPAAGSQGEGQPQQGGGQQAGDWWGQLPAEVQAEPALQKFRGSSLADFAGSVVGFQKLVGKDPASLIEVPKELDTKGRRSILVRLGLPEKADGYVLKAPDGSHPGVAPDTPMAKAFAAKAHEVGIFPDQAAALYQWYAGEVTKVAGDGSAASAAKDEENVAALQKEWGQAFQQNTAAVSTLIEKLGGKELREKVSAAGLGVDPTFLKAMLAVSKAYAEEGAQKSVFDGASQQFGGRLAPAEAMARGQAKLSEAMAAKAPADQRRLSAEAQVFFQQATVST